jgi:hypothetical protein
MMTNSSWNELRLILVFVFFASIPLIELVLSGIWNRLYFTKGLPLLVLRISVGNHYSNIPSQAQLEAPFRANWVQSLVFREIDPDKFAFREKIFQLRLFSYSPTMHGLLFFDRDNDKVVVKGFANWFMVLFFLMGIIGAINTDNPFTIFASLLLLVLLFGILYLVQFYRYSKVADFAAQAWSRHHLSELNTDSFYPAKPTR